MTPASCYCGGRQGRTIRRGARGGADVQIIECASCGVIRKGDLDPQTHRRLHLKDRQVKDINLDVRSDTYRERTRVDVERRIRDLDHLIGGDTRLLDVGTGMGSFPQTIRPAVKDIAVTEINPKRVTFLEEELGLPVFEDLATVRDAYGRGSFDVITMFHVLEHLVEPREHLSELRPLLSDDGVLVVEVPNHRDWLLHLSSSYKEFYYQEAHSYYFTARTLADIIASSGFDPEVRFIQRYALKNALHHAVKGRPELDDPSRFHDTWRRPLDKVYGAVLRMIGRTDTLWAIAKKGG